MNVEGEDLPALGMTAICLNCGVSSVSRGASLIWFVISGRSIRVIYSILYVIVKVLE